MQNQYNDGFGRYNHRSDKDQIFSGLILLVLFDGMSWFAPHPVGTIAILWPIVGLCWLHTRLGIEARHYNSDRWTEFLFAFKTFDELVMTVYVWPLSMFTTLLMNREHSSFRGTLEDEIFRDMMWEIPSHDTAVFASRDQFAYETASTLATSERTKQLPSVLAHETKLAGACGATVVTLATTAASASAAPTTSSSPSMSSSTNADITMSSYGWITGVSSNPDHGASQETLRHARVRVTIADASLHIGIFADADVNQLQTKDSDWLKQCYLTYTDKELTFRAGRMLTASGYSIPAPHAIETINYARLPFTYGGYALQADLNHGPWHLIADVSGRTDLMFWQHNQFDQLEMSGRIERKLNAKCTVALTGQAGESFTRTAFDVGSHPTAWLDVRGMAYYGTKTGTHGASDVTTAGLTSYVAVRPLMKLVPQLELHGQADAQESWNSTVKQPLILTGGIRYMAPGNKWSATADYQAGFGARHAGDANGLFLKLQTKF